MPNILDTVQISGSSYDLKDKNAPSVSAVTQQEYDNLPSSAKTSNTFFVISDAQAGDLSQYWTSAQTNSAITEAVSGKADSSAVTQEISAAVSGKQDTLSAGTNITIVDNVISATGGGGGGGKAIEAGRGISVTTGETADTVSFNLPIYLQEYTNLMYTSNNNTLKDGINSSYNSIFGSSNTIDKYGDNYNYPCAYNNIFGYGNKLFVDSLIKTLRNNFICGEHNTISSSTISIDNSFALGGYNKGNNSKQALIGWYNNATNVVEMSFGQYNVSSSGSSTFGDSGNTLFSVGNGTADNARHNAFEIRQNGDIYITSGGTDIKLQDNLGSGGGGGSSYTAGDGIDITNNVISVSGVVMSSAITTSISSSSTDAQVPSAKAVNDKLGGLSIVKLTQSEYDAIATKDNSTLYVIVN